MWVEVAGLPGCEAGYGRRSDPEPEEQVAPAGLDRLCLVEARDEGVPGDVGRDRVDALVGGSGDAVAILDGLRAIDRAAEGLVRNPNEGLLLQALLLRLPPLAV